MKKSGKIILLLMCISSLSMAATKNDNNNKVNNINKNIQSNINNIKKKYDLKFDINKNYETRISEVNGKTITYRAYENIVYVANPVDTKYQTINIYIPEEYFKGESIGKYNEKNAPIFFPNSVGGYMPGEASVPGKGRGGEKK